jgi:hypothetical protein
VGRGAVLGKDAAYLTQDADALSWNNGIQVSATIFGVKNGGIRDWVSAHRISTSKTCRKL